MSDGMSRLILELQDARLTVKARDARIKELENQLASTLEYCTQLEMTIGALQRELDA